MTDFKVSQYGTDTSGRPIWMSAYMHQWLDGITRELGWTPTVVQGAWMVRNGGGADASAGYHDKGGCLDFRVWDLTDTQREALIRATRWGGAASWVRDQAHGGMDPHIHIVLGSDADLAPGAAWQWLNYLGGGNGLSGSSAGPDYHPRPRPVVEVPPASLFGDWIDMATEQELTRLLQKEVVAPLRDSIRKYVGGVRELVKSNHRQVTAALEEARDAIDDAATKTRLNHAIQLIKDLDATVDATTEENA